MSTPFHVRTYETLVSHYSRRLTYLSTADLAQRLHADYRRTLRSLQRLKTAGIVQQRTQRGGWRPAPMAAAVYKTLLSFYRHSHDDVPTRLIARHLQNDEGWIRSYCRQLESAGIITRHSERSGWKPVRTAEASAKSRLYDLITTQSLTDTQQIASKLGVNPRYARQILSEYAQVGLIRRQGQRGGWYI